MSELLHAQKLEKERQDKLQKKNEAGRKRLHEISFGGQTQWSGNIKDLSNVTKVVESILSGKDVEKEYENVLDKLNIVNVAVLMAKRDEILGKYSNDVYFVRLLTQYTELLGDMVAKSTLQSVEKKELTPVKFFNGR